MGKVKTNNGVAEGMPIHSVRTVMVYHNKFRLCEFGKNKNGEGCFATFTDGKNSLTAYYIDGIVYKITNN